MALGSQSPAVRDSHRSLAGQPETGSGVTGETPLGSTGKFFDPGDDRGEPLPVQGLGRPSFRFNLTSVLQERVEPFVRLSQNFRRRLRLVTFYLHSQRFPPRVDGPTPRRCPPCVRRVSGWPYTRGMVPEVPVYTTDARVHTRATPSRGPGGHRRPTDVSASRGLTPMSGREEWDLEGPWSVLLWD